MERCIMYVITLLSTSFLMTSALGNGKGDGRIDTPWNPLPPCKVSPPSPCNSFFPPHLSLSFPLSFPSFRETPMSLPLGRGRGKYALISACWCKKSIMPERHCVGLRSNLQYVEKHVETRGRGTWHGGAGVITEYTEGRMTGEGWGGGWHWPVTLHRKWSCVLFQAFVTVWTLWRCWLWREEGSGSQADYTIRSSRRGVACR